VSELAAAPETTPDAVRVVPLSAPMLLSLLSAMVPDHVLEPVMLWRAPLAPEPKPLSVRFSATVKPVPLTLSVAPLATVVAPVVLPRPVALWISRMPELMAVAPLYVLAPESTQMPVPFLVSEVAPVPLLPSVEANVPALEPVSVNVRAVLAPLKTTPPALVKLRVPVPEASIVLPAVVPTVNSRSVLTPPPVYCSVPPFNTRLAAALVEAPILLFALPLARELTESTPPVTEVTPV
jgi:hypothetical protein